MSDITVLLHTWTLTACQDPYKINITKIPAWKSGSLWIVAPSWEVSDNLPIYGFCTSQFSPGMQWYGPWEIIHILGNGCTPMHMRHTVDSVDKQNTTKQKTREGNGEPNGEIFEGIVK